MMKRTLLPLFALVVAHVAATGVFAQSSTTVSASATTADLAAEFLKWKASSAGQDAYANDFVPASIKESTSSVPTTEELQRFQAAKDRVARMQTEQPLAEFSVETPFALMTPAEFAAFVNKGGAQSLRQLPNLAAAGQTSTGPRGVKPSSSSRTNRTATTSSSRQLEAQAQQGWVVDTDWQTKGCVTRIKDQGQCGSCTMFATVAALESGYCAKMGGQLYELSEQDLISCATGSGAYRCSGSRTSENLQWITKFNGGSVCTEATYPYASASGTAPNCRRYEDPNFSCETPDIGARLYAGASFYSHTLLEDVVRQQPAAATLYASAMFQDYKGGVLRGDESRCPADSANHAVLIVGFGWLDGVPYWKIKNQWGESWGDHGWMYIERGYQGHPLGACGVESYVVYPIFVPESHPSQTKRCDSARYGVRLEGKPIDLLLDVPSAEHCCDLCRVNDACEGYNWSQDRTYMCLLLAQITGETRQVERSFAGRMISKAKDMEKAAFFDNYDFFGNDLRQTPAATAEDCADKCNQYLGCNAFTWSKWNRGMCYLKSSQMGQVTYVGPPADGSPPTVRSGVSFKCKAFETDVVFVGGDIESKKGSLEECCGFCRERWQCAAYTWTFDNDGTCYLKDTTYTIAPPPGDRVAISGLV